MTVEVKELTEEQLNKVLDDFDEYLAKTMAKVQDDGLLYSEVLSVVISSYLSTMKEFVDKRDFENYISELYLMMTKNENSTKH